MTTKSFEYLLVNLKGLLAEYCFIPYSLLLIKLFLLNNSFLKYTTFLFSNMSSCSPISWTCVFTLILNVEILYLQIGLLTDRQWKRSRLGVYGPDIDIHVTPPVGEENDDFIPSLRMRRKLSTPLSALPGGLLNISSKIDYR